jgi:phosphoglucomutase
MTFTEKYQQWLSEVPVGTPIHQELLAIRENTAEQEARFGADLTFGTAGLRGIMGAGTDRMNVYTVRRAALA